MEWDLRVVQYKKPFLPQVALVMVFTTALGTLRRGITGYFMLPPHWPPSAGLLPGPVSQNKPFPLTSLLSWNFNIAFVMEFYYSNKGQATKMKLRYPHCSRVSLLSRAKIRAVCIPFH